ATSHTFTVTYHDEAGTLGAGIDVSTLIDNSAAVRVGGPSGFDVPATYVSIDTATSGSPRTVTYSFTPPGGAWDPTDGGTYPVRVQAGAVKDVDGNAIPAGTIGTLLVSIPRTLVVTTAADAGAGSLREAITLANETPAPDEIVFDVAGLFATPQTISLATALPVIAAAGGPLAIRGPGKDRLTVDGNDAVRGLSSAAPELTLTGFTIANGAAEDGAGLWTTGVTTLDGMVIRDNHATGLGGGVYRAAGAFLAVRNSTISGNSSPFNGGGIVTYDAGGLIVESSTVSGNTVVNGGQVNGYYGGAGIWFNGTPSAGGPAGFEPGVVLIRNSTVANNFTDGSAGGIALVDFGGATLRVENSTISGNEAEKTGTSMFGLPYGGGGIRGFAGEVIAVITNSVVSGNVNADGPDLFFELATVEATNSAFGDPSGWASEVGNNLIGENLLLGPLQDNGGPTLTMAPLPGSPLLDAGDSALVPAGLTRDQRGLPRVDGPAVDIGAVETQRPAVTIDRAPGQDDPTGRPAINFAVAFSEPITGFTAADVDLSASTAGGPLAATVAQTGPTTYTVTVTGMTSRGDVVASIPADAATNAAGFGNSASTSTDNAVAFLNAGTVTVSTASRTVAEGTEVTFTLSRTGGSEGDVSVRYATVAGTARETSDFTAVSDTFEWVEGNTDDQTFTVTIPADGANEGKELFAIELTDPDGGVQIGTSTYDMAIAPSNGLKIEAAARPPRATFVEQAGPAGDAVTVQLTGKVGSATVYITDTDGDGLGPIEWIELADTDAAMSGLAVTPKRPKGGTGDGRTTVAEVSGTGLKSLTAPKVDLIGTGIHLSGYLGSLKVSDVGGGADIIVGGAPPAALRNPSVRVTAGVIADGSDLTVAAAPLGSLAVIAMGDGTVAAPSIGTITAKGRARTKSADGIPGDFNADVSSGGAVKKLKVAGGVTDALVTVAGDLGGVRVAGRVTGTNVDVTGNVGSVSVGSFWNSRLDAGYTGANTGGGTFDAASAIGPFRVTAATAGFQNSYVIATTIRPVTLASITAENGGTKFGFIARETLAGLTVTAPGQKFKFDPTLPSPQPSPQQFPEWDFQAVDLDGPAGP
ncbi:MAG TPA: choice-of-anchor Q domain-containing protein, partial [Gemmataceae bacterium]|nr:choice-of-anchor Q domain-containing protein [Gemmataceae bacterium]